MSEPVTLLFLAAVNFLAALVQGSCGFGYGLIAMALMPLALPMSVCSAASAVTVVAIGLQMTLALRKQLQPKVIALPVGCCLLTVNLGLYLLDTFDELTLRIILASLLVVVTALFFIMRRKRLALPDRWYSAVGAGLLAGLSTGLFNIVGPFLLIYYMNICKTTLQLKANLEFSFLIAGMYSLVMHLFVYQNITLAVLPQVSSAAIAAVVAGFVGLKIYRRINADRIALLVYILLPIMAATLVYNGMQ